MCCTDSRPLFVYCTESMYLTLKWTLQTADIPHGLRSYKDANVYVLVSRILKQLTVPTYIQILYMHRGDRLQTWEAVSRKVLWSFLTFLSKPGLTASNDISVYSLVLPVLSPSKVASMYNVYQKRWRGNPCKKVTKRTQNTSKLPATVAFLYGKHCYTNAIDKMFFCKFPTTLGNVMIFL